MKLDIKSINPYYAYVYLTKHGWQQESWIDTRTIILSIDKNHKKRHILLPLDRDMPDFYLRMYDLLQSLESTEKRSKMLIISDLVNPFDTYVGELELIKILLSAASKSSKS